MNVAQGKNYINYRTSLGSFWFRSLGTGALALAVCVAALPAAAQDQNAQDERNDQQQRAGDPGQYRDGGGDQGQFPSGRPAPLTLTLTSGTVISVRVDEWLSSDKNQPGDRFSATLEQPLVANGWVVARRGQVITGRVEVAQKAGHGNPSSRLGVALSELTLVDGQVLPVNTELVQAGTRPNANTGRDVAVVGTTAALGAIIGGVAGGGTGAAIGAGIGAAGGAIGVMSTHGGPTVIQPETPLTFRLEAPLAISTDQSHVAFQPVGQEDYNSSSRRDQDAYGGATPRRVVAPPPVYPYYNYYGYGPYPYGWGYPGPSYLGFYGGGFYGGFYGPTVIVHGGGGHGGFHGGYRR